jgi:hypothetical protein
MKSLFKIIHLPCVLNTAIKETFTKLRDKKKLSRNVHRLMKIPEQRLQH